MQPDAEFLGSCDAVVICDREGASVEFSTNNPKVKRPLTYY